MQNLSASDLLSLEAGFQTAHEEQQSQEPDCGTSSAVDRTRASQIHLATDYDTRAGSRRATGESQTGPAESDDSSVNKRRLSGRRALWQDRSLLEKSMWLHDDDDDDGEVGKGANKREDRKHGSVNDAGDENSRHQTPVRIRVEAYNSIDESADRQHHHDQPVAPPPSRSSSALDLPASSTASAASDSSRLEISRLHKAQSSNDMSQHEQTTSAILLNIKQYPFQESLSDSSAHRLTKYNPNSGGFYGPQDARRFGARFASWKRSNKFITRVHENPFNLHLDCLEQLHSEILQATESNSENLPRKSEDELRPKTTTTTLKLEVSVEQTLQTSNDQDHDQQATGPQATQELNNYANNLTHLYRKNQETMDSSNDFRTLLYNIICCLLVQDDQVLLTPSVGKMLDVIRTHLDSASRVYAHTSAQLISNLTRLNHAGQGGASAAVTEPVGVRKESSGSCATTQTSSSVSTSEQTPECGSHENVYDFLRPDMNRATTANQKPADFRRISSVSYNDEQLINDLCDENYLHQTGPHGQIGLALQQQHSGNMTMNDRRGDEYSPSPWAYQELSERRLSSPAGKGPANGVAHDSQGGGGSGGSQQYTSQSSLEQITPTLCNNDDSGNGTMYDFQFASDFGGYGGQGRRRASVELQDRAASLCCSESFLTGCTQQGSNKLRQLRRLSDFKPKQQPSYMSTDDYLSSTANNNNNNNSNNPNRTSIYDDDNEHSSALQKCDFNGTVCCGQGECDFDGDGQVGEDAASRRAELEWTLNKLINIELKLIWLTSRDTLRRAIRKIGVPNEIRGKVWLILIEQMIGSKYDAERLLEEARATIVDQDENNVRLDDETQSILKQIELDVNRTMPGHRLFDDGAEGGVKLRRILVAYSIHVNRAIDDATRASIWFMRDPCKREAYCQGFNFIVALLLSVFEGDEKKALRGFICIVDHIFPSKYYFDHYLTGARADQFLLADFICDQLIKNPTLAERKMVEGITSSITLNWFISLFHGAVPTLTRLTILDHFMLEGVKALFKFTMAILYLAFQVTPPSSCEIFTTIRTTAKDMYDIKLLLSIVNQIKLPKDSYFAIRRSFYMVQSSFNSDQFYMQTLSSSGASRNCSASPSKPLSVQRLPETKPPAISLMTMSSNASFVTTSGLAGTQTGDSSHMPSGGFTIKNSICTDNMQRPRTRTSADKTKVCIQSLGKLGRSHLRIIDTNTKSNERALMSPLRNCFLIGISNCGKNLIIARQSSKRNYRSFREQDLTFHIHEISTEIFDGFYLEESQLAVIITHLGEIFKINCRQCAEGNSLNHSNYLEECTETLMLRDFGSSVAEHEKVKLRLSTMDSLTNLLWIYVECEDMTRSGRRSSSTSQTVKTANATRRLSRNFTCATPDSTLEEPQAGQSVLPKTATKFKNNNPFLEEIDEFEDKSGSSPQEATKAGYDWQQVATAALVNSRPSFTRKIIIVDIITFDLFSAFAVHPNFGEITNLRASLVAFCQLSNPMSNQFSTRIVQIGPTGRYEQLLSFSDVVDYMVSVPETYRKKYHNQQQQQHQQATSQTLPSHLGQDHKSEQQQQRYSSLRRLLTHSMSFSANSDAAASGGTSNICNPQGENGTSNALTKYYRNLMRSYSMNLMDQNQQGNKQLAPSKGEDDPPKAQASAKLVQDHALRSIISSSFGDFSELSETNYIPVNMAFIFRNGKIALFEFTENYAIHTRESQLDRYDYSKVIDVIKSGEDFIVIILTVFDKLIKVII